MLYEKRPLAFDRLVKKMPGISRRSLIKTMNDEETHESSDAKTITSDEIDPEMRERAMCFLKFGDPVEHILKHVDQKIHGGRAAARAMAVSCYSAFMDEADKLHADVVGSSQAGKSAVVTTVLETFPQENVCQATEASPKSIYYLAKDSGERLKNLIFYLDDAREEQQ